MSRGALLGLALIVCVACSASGRYEFVRAAGEAKARCETRPTAAAEAECRSAYETTYETYEAERRAMEKEAEEQTARQRAQTDAHAAPDREP